jgi:5-aminopentanamidase
MKLAALQMHAVAGDRTANLFRIEKAAREAAAQGADLLVAPELAVTGYGAGELMSELAEAADGDLAQKLAAVANETGIWNSAIYADGHRSIVYRKSHLFGPYEQALFKPERPAACVIEHRGLKLGMLICYDVEFPENVRRLALAGAQAVIVPTALPASDHAELIARKMIAVRAFENQIFVAYVNHCGADALFSYAGLSGIAAPDGTMLAEAPETGEALLFAELDPAAYAASAAANSYLADLRT